MAPAQLRYRLCAMSQVVLETLLSGARYYFLCTIAPCPFLCCAWTGWCSYFGACLAGSTVSIWSSTSDVCECKRCSDACPCLCDRRRKPVALLCTNSISLMLRIAAIIGVCLLYNSARQLRCLTATDQINNASVYNASMDDSIDGYSNSSTFNSTTGETPATHAATFKHVDDDLIDYQELCKHSSQHRLQSVLFVMIWILAGELLLSLCAMCVQRKRFFAEDEAEDNIARNPYDANYSPVQQNSKDGGQNVQAFGGSIHQPAWMGVQEVGNDTKAAAVNPSWV